MEISELHFFYLQLFWSEMLIAAMIQSDWMYKIIPGHVYTQLNEILDIYVCDISSMEHFHCK